MVAKPFAIRKREEQIFLIKDPHQLHLAQDPHGADVHVHFVAVLPVDLVHVLAPDELAPVVVLGQRLLQAGQEAETLGLLDNKGGGVDVGGGVGGQEVALLAAAGDARGEEKNG